MHEKFLELIECLIGKRPIGPISDYKKELEEIVTKFNHTLNLTNDDEMFHSTYYDSETIISPVPFSTFNTKSNVVYFGLNPKLDTESENELTRIEKELAGTTWEEYADFYLSDEITKHVIDPIGPYVQKQISIIESLKQKKYVTWPQFRSNLTKREIEDKSINLLRSLLGVECVPFHSKTFSLGMSDLDLLLDELPEYKSYIHKLFKTVDDSLESDGWIICNGNNACNTFKKLVESEDHFPELMMIKDERTERAYSFHLWGSRKVILCHHMIGAINSKLNSHDQRQQMIEDALETFLPEKVIAPQQQEHSSATDIEFEYFGASMPLAKAIDHFILHELEYDAYRMLNIKDGLSYHERIGMQGGGFAKLCSKDNKLIIRFGQRAQTDSKLGWLKQLEFDKKFDSLNKRQLSNIKNFHNEAFIYLDTVDSNNKKHLTFIKEQLKEAYGMYYK